MCHIMCHTKVSHKRVTQKGHIHVSHTVSHKSITQKCHMCHILCHTKGSHMFHTKVSHKSITQKGHTRFTYKCHTKVSHKRVSVTHMHKKKQMMVLPIILITIPSHALIRVTGNVAVHLNFLDASVGVAQLSYKINSVSHKSVSKSVTQKSHTQVSHKCVTQKYDFLYIYQPTK